MKYLIFMLLLILLAGCNRPTQEMLNMMHSERMASRIIYFKDARQNCFASIYSVTVDGDDIPSITYVPKENCK